VAYIELKNTSTVVFCYQVSNMVRDCGKVEVVLNDTKTCKMFYDKL